MLESWNFAWKPRFQLVISPLLMVLLLLGYLKISGHSILPFGARRAVDHISDDVTGTGIDDVRKLSRKAFAGLRRVIDTSQPALRSRKMPIFMEPIRVKILLEPSVGNFSHHWPSRVVQSIRPQFYNKNRMGCWNAIVSTALQVFSLGLEKASVALQNNSGTSWKNHRIVLDALSKTYFSDVKRVKNVKTVIAMLHKGRFIELFPRLLFIGHSNNCSRLGRHSQGNARINILLRCTEDNQYLVYNTKAAAALITGDFDFKTGLFRSKPSRSKKGVEQDMMVGFVHVVKDAIIDTTGDIYSGEVHFLSQHCHREASHNNNYTELELARMFRVKQVFVIAQYWGNAFFHFVAECLPRLALALPFLWRNRQVKIYVNEKSKFTVELLQDLGISGDRVIGGAVFAEMAYLPHGTPCGRAAIPDFLLLASYLRNQDDELMAPPDTIVVIKRSPISRWFRYHNLIVRALKALTSTLTTPIKVTVFDDVKLPSYKDTKALFGRALMIVAPHGAGLSNMVFSRPGVCIVEGLCYDKYNLVQPCYQHMAHVLGHIYHGVITPHQCMEMTPRDLLPHVYQCLQFVLNSSLPEFRCNAMEYGCGNHIKPN